MKLIFLDVDGVLNTHEELHPEVLCGQIHKDKVEKLNRILRETDAKIVLSSAWRYLVHRGEMNMQGFDWLLRSHGVLANRLVGITREDTLRESKEFDGKHWPLHNERGQQISEWIVRNWMPENPNGIPKYVVIDDLDLGISEARHPFILIDSICGLHDEDVEKAIKILNDK